MLDAASAVRPGLGEGTLARAREGDEAAFADIVRGHQAMVFSIAHRFIGDRSAAEDLAQDVFLRLHQNLQRVESPAHLTFWLRQVASRCCIDWFRRTSRSGEVSLDGDDLPAAPARLMSRDILLEERIRRLVNQLPPRARLVVTLRYQEDLEASEIAVILDMPLNTVKSHLHRSVEQLRRWLADSGSRP